MGEEKLHGIFEVGSHFLGFRFFFFHVTDKTIAKMMISTITVMIQASMIFF